MNVRPLIFAIAALAATSAFADPLKFTVRVKGEKVGTFVDEITGDDSSGYLDDSTLTMKVGGNSTTIHEIEHYGKDGIDTSKTIEATQEGHTAKIKAVLGDDGAHLSIWIDDNKEEKDVPLSGKTSRADATNFWWKKAPPKEGDSVTYQSFEMDDLKWTDVTLKYVGKAKIKIGDKEIEANEVDRTEGDETSKIYVDDKGDPLLLELPMEEGVVMRIERDID
jgi:hypothetical protein